MRRPFLLSWLACVGCAFSCEGACEEGIEIPRTREEARRSRDKPLARRALCDSFDQPFSCDPCAELALADGEMKPSWYGDGACDTPGGRPGYCEQYDEADCEAPDVCEKEIGLRCSEFDAGFIKADEPSWMTRFGSDLALFGETLAVLAPSYSHCEPKVGGGDPGSCSHEGVVFLYEDEGPDRSWTFAQKLIPYPNERGFDRHRFVSVSLDDDVLAIRDRRSRLCPGEECQTKSSLQFYEKDMDGVWWSSGGSADLDESRGAPLWDGRKDVVIASKTAFAVASDVRQPCDAESASECFDRSVRVVEVVDGWWAVADNLELPRGDQNLFYEPALAANVHEGELHLFVGFPDPVAGSVRVYKRSSERGEWVELPPIVPEEPLPNFGASLAYRDSTLVVGSPGAKDYNGYYESGDQCSPSDRFCDEVGSLHIYTPERDGSGSWIHTQHVHPPTETMRARFGTRVALGARYLFVGLPSDSSCATGLNGDWRDSQCGGQGAVLAYPLEGGEVRTARDALLYIKPRRPQYQAGESLGVRKDVGYYSSAYFGDALAASGDALAIGAPADSLCASLAASNEPHSQMCRDSGAVHLRRFARSRSE